MRGAGLRSSDFNFQDMKRNDFLKVVLPEGAFKFRRETRCMALAGTEQSISSIAPGVGCLAPQQDAGETMEAAVDAPAEVQDNSDIINAVTRMASIRQNEIKVSIGISKVTHISTAHLAAGLHVHAPRTACDPCLAGRMVWRMSSL